MPVTWNDALMSTGVGEIDAQHKELITRLNALLDAMGRGKGKDEVEGMLKFLGEYAVWHFGEEEQCMNAYRCPVAAANKKAHADFLQTFGRIANTVSRDGPTLGLLLELEREVSEWVRSHIVRIDTHLRSCVSAAAGGAAAGTA